MKCIGLYFIMTYSSFWQWSLLILTVKYLAELSTIIFSRWFYSYQQMCTFQQIFSKLYSPYCPSGTPPENKPTSVPFGGYFSRQRSSVCSKIKISSYRYYRYLPFANGLFWILSVHGKYVKNKNSVYFKTIFRLKNNRTSYTVRQNMH